MTQPPSFFYVHVMKTAGTTFVSHLQRQFGAAAIYPNRQSDRRFPTDVDAYMNIERLLALPPERHATLRAYAGHFPYMVCELLGIELVTITMLRDPVERTISALKQFKRQDKYAALPVEEIYEDDEVFRWYVHNHQTKIFSLVPADKPRAFLKPIVVDDARFTLARENLERVDVVGVTEHLDRFMQELQRRFGWWPDGLDAGKRTNVSAETLEIPPAFRRRIADDNAYDLELYEDAKTRASERG